MAIVTAVLSGVNRIFILLIEPIVFISIAQALSLSLLPSKADGVAPSAS